MANIERYLECTEAIDCATMSVKTKAIALTHGIQTDRNKAVSLFYFVRDEIKHNPYAPLDRVKASATLEAGNGTCWQKSILLVALARAVGIPARLGFVDIYDYQISDIFKEMAGGTNLLALHGYTELSINGKWVHASPAYDLKICQKMCFVPVEFDGVNDAKDSRYDQNGRLHIEHVKDHRTFDDFPKEWMMNYAKRFVAELGLELDDLLDVGQRIRQGKAYGEL